MGNDVEAVQVNNGHDKSELGLVTSKEEEVKLLREAVRSLPKHAVEDLLAIGVCIRCILRLFGLHDCICSSASFTQLMLLSFIGREIGLEGHMVENSFNTHQYINAHRTMSSEHTSQELETVSTSCRICLGILQFTSFDDKDILVKSDCASDFAELISVHIKQEGHQIDSFSIEVSLPQLITENEQSVCLYMKKKYESEVWFKETFLSGCIFTKDALKLSISSPLETLLGAKSGLSAFRIRLTYVHSDAPLKNQNTTKQEQCNKRRKTDCGSRIACLKSSSLGKSGEYEPSKGYSSKDDEISDCFYFQQDKISLCCHLNINCYRTPICVGGRYLKYSRNVSQTRWIVDDERMGEASVEEIIGSNILSTCRGDSYKFHAAGREDIDVRMLGSGRPFLVEIHNARLVLSEVHMEEIESKINNLEKKLVKVKSLKVLDSEGWTLMREGEAEKQKEYAALVWISRSLKDDDFQTLSSLKNMTISQKTPIRVLHRRSPLERPKIIHWMKIERIDGSSQYFLLRLCTQAGTYIKEFVHGDLGRTQPSLGSILGCRAEIMQLDVTDVKMDHFLAE